MAPECVRLVNPSPVVARLAAKLATRGSGEARERLTWMLGADDDLAAVLAAGIGERDRILVVSWIGAHPDAGASVLSRLWALEERCRESGFATLTVRLGPLAGPESPLWQKLAYAKPRSRLARKPVHPVLESQVVEVIERALIGAVTWNGWQELGGPDIMTLGECAEHARRSAFAGEGEWEPDLEALAEQRLIEPQVWSQWSGMEPMSVSTEAATWAA